MSEELEDAAKTFLLPAEVQYGYLPVCSSHIEVSSVFRHVPVGSGCSPRCCLCDCCRDPSYQRTTCLLLREIPAPRMRMEWCTEKEL